MDEIERKFLLFEIPDYIQLKVSDVNRIEQSYISISDPEVRIRKVLPLLNLSDRSTKYYETIKRGKGLIRKEVEIELSFNQFTALSEMAITDRIVKNREKAHYEGHTLEMDAFLDNLVPIRMIEIEFKSKEEAESFKVPRWFGQEVTDNPVFKNVNMIQDPAKAVSMYNQMKLQFFQRR